MSVCLSVWAADRSRTGMAVNDLLPCSAAPLAHLPSGVLKSLILCPVIAYPCLTPSFLFYVRLLVLGLLVLCLILPLLLVSSSFPYHSKSIRVGVYESVALYNLLPRTS